MTNKVVELNKNDEMFKEIADEINNAKDDQLMIMARSYKNRKDDEVAPIAIKNGIYFYLTYDLGNNKYAYPSNQITVEQIYKAKTNMVRRARLGSMMSIAFSDGDTLDDFMFTGDPMNVVTLDNKMYGSGLLYCEEFIRAIRNKIGDCYILPSSIHELIFVPSNVVSKSDLCDMVHEVNKSAVSEIEYLADRAFTIDEWL